PSDGPVPFPTNAAAIEDRRARRRPSRGRPKAAIPGRQLEAAITMKVSYFETGRYRTPSDMPAIWPMPAAAYDAGEGTRVYQGMIERIALAENLGFDWVSLSEHHYSPRILTPSPQVAAAYVAARVHR